MPLLNKGSKLYSSCYLKCPKCHEGNLFPTGSFSFQRPFDMYDRCPNCNFNYWPEPGYYYGAMFISYIISGWFCIGFALLFHWVFDWSLTATFGLLIGFLAVIFVWFFRFSRAIWLNINYKYDPERKEVMREK
ncbi:MAG: DUF983 domain-containing protein [Bacteroidota bacterium]